VAAPPYFIHRPKLILRIIVRIVLVVYADIV
jgi:hypothetical protein